MGSGGGGGGGAGLEADLHRIRCFFSSLMCISLIRRSIRERLSLLALLSISLVEAMYELRVTRKADETWTNCITISGGIVEAKDVEKGGKGEIPGTPPASSPAAPAAVAAAPAAIISSTALLNATESLIFIHQTFYAYSKEKNNETKEIHDNNLNEENGMLQFDS